MFKQGLCETFVKTIFIEDLFEMYKTQIPRFVNRTGVTEHVAREYKAGNEVFI